MCAVKQRNVVKKGKQKRKEKKTFGSFDGTKLSPVVKVVVVIQKVIIIVIRVIGIDELREDVKFTSILSNDVFVII